MYNYYCLKTQLRHSQWDALYTSNIGLYGLYYIVAKSRRRILLTV